MGGSGTENGRTGRKVALGALWFAFAVLLGVGIWEYTTGGGVIEIGPLSISAHSPERPFFGALLALVLLLIFDRRLRALRGLFSRQRDPSRWERPGALVAWLRGVPLARRLGVLVLAVALVTNASAWINVFGARRALHAKSEFIADSGLCANGAQDHLSVLVEAITSSDDPRDVAVHIHGRDPRGHLTSYYAYPRLLYMGPELRRWSILHRMLRTGHDDPGFADPGPEPGIDESRRFAESRGLPLIEVWPDRTRVLAPEPEVGTP